MARILQVARRVEALQCPEGLCDTAAQAWFAWTGVVSACAPSVPLVFGL